MAREEYRQAARENSIDIKVTETGFWTNPKFPGLGCSPDNLVLDPALDVNMEGLVEIKCPYIFKSHNVTNIDELLTRAQVNRFCLERVNQELHLKRTHQN